MTQASNQDSYKSDRFYSLFAVVFSVCGFKWKREWKTSYKTSFTVDAVRFPYFVQMTCSTADKMSSVTWLQLPRLNHWMADYCASAYMALCFFCEEMSLCCHIHWRHAVPALLERHLKPTCLHRRVHAYTASHLLKLYVVVNCSRGMTCNFMVQLAMTQASNQDSK